MLSIPGIISLILLVPYVGWGIHTLRKRYILREEMPLWVEAATLGFLVVFFALELSLSSEVFTGEQLSHITAILGLFVSGAALYGAMLNALFSRVIVGLISPGEEHAVDQPRFGPAEALEYQGEDEAALQEYTVIARIYPWHAGVYLRIAEVCVRMRQYQEAVEWLGRGLKQVDTAQHCQPILLRLSDIYNGHLDKPEESRRILEDFLARFPDVEEGINVRNRLARVEGNFSIQSSNALISMEETPLAQEPPAQEAAPKKKSAIKLEAMDGESEQK